MVSDGQVGDRVQVRCILVVGSGPDARAELVTPWHSARQPLSVRAEDIAAQADLPVGELPGRAFWPTAKLRGWAGSSWSTIHVDRCCKTTL